MHRHEDVDTVLSKFLLDYQLFGDHEKITFVCLVIGGDHDKGFFTMLLTMSVEMESRDEQHHMDEVVDEIDSTEDKLEILHPLITNIAVGVLRHIMSSVTCNMTITIGANKEKK